MSSGLVMQISECIYVDHEGGTLEDICWFRFPILLPGHHELSSFAPPHSSAMVFLPWKKLSMELILQSCELSYIFLPLS